MWNKTPKTVQVAVEYYAPHWIVVIRNAGQKHWAALRSKTKMIVEQDEFGQEISKRPAIHSFVNMAEAQEWVTNNMPGTETIVREARDVQSFAQKLKGDHVGQLASIRDVHASTPYAAATRRTTS
jgi:hypothetical protein